MTRTRWTGLAGVLLAVLFMAVNLTAPSTPSNTGSGGADRYQKFWTDSGHQDKAKLAALILTYAVLVLLVFAAGLRDRLRAVDAGPLPSYVLAAGTAASALIAVGGLLGLSIGLVAGDAPSFKVDGSSAMQIDVIAYTLIAMGFMFAASMAAAVGIVTLRTRVLPVWTAWLGFLLALGELGSFYTGWIGFLGLPLWSVVIGIVLLMRADAPDAVATA